MIDNDKSPLTSFIKKKRKEREILQRPIIEVIPTPWYKRPLEASEFTHRRAKDGKWYVQHKDWSERVWIGPYLSVIDVKDIINSYVTESLKDGIEKKLDSRVHSLIVDNPEEFF